MLRPGILMGLVCALVLSPGVLAAPVQTFMLNNGLAGEVTTAPGHVFLYESFVQTPGEVYDENNELIAAYTDWFYDYYIENGSSDHTITEWYWFSGGFGGPVNGRILPDGGLGPASADGLNPTDSFFESYFESPDGCVQVGSRVVFEDGYSEVLPVYVPASLVPEPSSLVALAAGMAWACACGRRWRMR